MMTLTEIREKRNELKTTLLENIEKFMESHNCTELDATEFDDTPVILEDLERSDYSYTMDRLTRCSNGNVRVECSNCEDNDSFYTSVLSTDTLIDIYEWLLDNEEFMDFE